MAASGEHQVAQERGAMQCLSTAAHPKSPICGISPLTSFPCSEKSVCVAR